MKLITAYLHRVRTAEVVQALADAGYRNLVFADVRGTLPGISDDERDYSSEGAGIVIGAVGAVLVAMPLARAPQVVAPFSSLARKEHATRRRARRRMWSMALTTASP